VTCAPRHVGARTRRPGRWPGCFSLWAGVEHRASLRASENLPLRGSAGPAPSPLRCSTPAQSSKHSGELGAVPPSMEDRGGFGGGAVAPLRCAEPLSLDRLQMISPKAKPRPRLAASGVLAGPQGAGSLPARLRRAVNRQAPVLRFASAFQVTARRLAGGPPLPGVRGQSPPSLLNHE